MGSSRTLINIWVKKSHDYYHATHYYYFAVTIINLLWVGWISDRQSYHSSSTDLCSCYYQSVHSQSHSWPLSGNGMSPLCWCTALLHDSCWHPVNTRWYLRRFERRTSVIGNFYNLFRVLRRLQRTKQTKHFQLDAQRRHTLTGLFIWFKFVAVETGTRVVAHAALSARPWENNPKNPAGWSLFLLGWIN